MAYITSENYEKIIYSGGAEHRLKIWFNEVELEDADLYCEKLTVSSRVLSSGSSKVFTLDNFVSKELTLILHNIPLDSIVDQVKISLGTLVGEEYEYVPLGVFNIQDRPTTDKDKITIKLRDNSVKFDFGYNAQPLIETNGGTATKMQILQDICNQAGVVCNITEFLGANGTVGVYDNTIKGRTYVSYICEQAGAIATINRDGELIFIYLADLVTRRIPLSIVEKYSIGQKYKISRVVYEDALRKFEVGTEANDTLYINSGNPYISEQGQIDGIYNLVNGFTIDSLTTGKILGNPSIDPYDIIEIYDDYTEDETIIARTLANNSLVYNGVLINTFATEISIEARKENVNITGEATFKKWAKTEIDNINAEVEITVGKVEGNTQQINSLKVNLDGISNYLESAGGTNLLRNPIGMFNNDYWNGDGAEPYTDTYIQNKTGQRSCWLLNNGNHSQTVQVKNGKYTFTMMFEKLITLSTVILKINDKEYELQENTHITFEVTDNHITVEFIGDVDKCAYLMNLMLNEGTIAQVYSNNANETISDTVMIGKGIQIRATGKNTELDAQADGIRIKNINTGDTTTEFTDKGTITNDLTAHKATIAKVLIADTGSQTLFTRL